MLAGAACVAIVRLLALPFAGSQIPGAHAGVGWWLTLACGVALTTAAVAAVRGAFHTPEPRSGSIR